jgi:glycosyltransferase involved in cell wall biosynthesis
VTTPLSCTIIARNEADRIGRTIEAARTVADEVLVVDSGSTDDTVAVAERLGARVLRRDWTGYGPQKRFAEEQAAHDWILNLDADEVLSSELQAELRELLTRGPDKPAWRMRIVNMYAGHARPHPGSQAYEVVRLYDRRVVRYSDSPVHDRVVVGDAPVGRLKGIVLHYAWRSLEHLRAKLEAYADFQVGKVKKPRWQLMARLPFEYPSVFLKYYLLRANALGGLTGLRISHMAAAVRTRRLVKMLEHDRAGARP